MLTNFRNIIAFCEVPRLLTSVLVEGVRFAYVEENEYGALVE
jgi:hypothetical protein